MSNEININNEKIKSISTRFKDISNIFLSVGVIGPVIGFFLNSSKFKGTENEINAIIVFILSIIASGLFTYFELKVLEKIK